MGLTVGWVTAPEATKTPPAFRATNALILKPGQTDFSKLLQYAAVATLGAVPSRVAARVGVDGPRLRTMVSVETPPNTGQLLITARGSDGALVVAIANDTAEELIAELGGPEKSPLETLEPAAVASPVPSDDIKGPTSRPGRALMLGAFGLLLGVGAALTVERFDNRVRTKGTAERALGVPVMAEVPVLPRGDRDRILTAPGSPVFEAYRGLRTGVVLAEPRVIVVTSASGGEGKTAAVAHLAAALAEVGHSVVAVSADLRRPRLHEYFDRPRDPGLSDMLRGAPDVRRLEDLKLTTGLRGIRFVASGEPVPDPVPLIGRLGEHLADAREMAEFVLVDSPPLLVASEAADLARLADAVLLVVRAGRTSIGAAARSAEMLERLGVPLLGAVLVGGDVPRP